MHFSIPDTSDISDKGNTFTVFNLHINGAYHCSVRYRLFHTFHDQLKKEFGVQSLPTFPPKKLLSLSAAQLEERRAAIERYVQILSQNQQIAASDIFNQFLLQAQQESQKEVEEAVSLNVFLANGHKINIDITSTNQTDTVLEVVASDVQIPDDFVYYFGLYLVRCEYEEYSIVRKLQEFESPYISLKAANQNGKHRIVLHKSYWDPVYDDDLIHNRVAMNLLYVQALSDVEKSWILATKEEHKQMQSLQQKGSKKEFLRFVRTLKYYGYVQFPMCTVDHPEPGCQAVIAAGNRELNFRIHLDQNVIKEVSFRVTRMRCWRITTTIPESNGDIAGGGDASHSHSNAQLELAFEYLVARNNMQWITIYSDQAIVISMCLQGMVDELVMRKEGRKFKKPQDRQRKSGSSSKQGQDPTPSAQSPTSPLQLPPPVTDTVVNGSSQPVVKPKHRPGSSVDKPALPTRLLGGRPMAKAALSENSAFEGIGDDDL